MPEFARSVAAVIGVDAYRHGVAPLTTAVRDARAIAACLTRDHGYEVRLLLDGQASLAGLTNLLQETLQKWVGADDRLLVYFAGHGIALDGEGGPEGFLVPADARPDDRGSLLPMVAVNAALEALPCRHGLLVLDCCFAGSFRWATTRSFVPVTRTMTRKRYERFLESPAWQVLTSAAHDQTALDALGGLRVNHREAQGAALAAGHSPFAASLLAGLQGAADVAGDGGRPDGVITATELYLYLRDQVEAAAADQLASQTPGLWPLRRHGRGEFLFHVAGRALSLEPDPPLDEAANPWLGLRAYAPEDDALFFGRERVLASLRERVLAGTGEEEAPAEDVEPLIAVLGVSGAGKSSVVNAGLVPWLRRARGDAWVVIGPRRPGGAPMAALDAIERELAAAPAGAWRLVVIDQFEEIYSLCRDAGARAGFFARINTWLSSQAKLRVLLTARADYEPQLSGCALAPRLARGRFVIPPMTSDELRAVIEGPASARVLYFEPPELVDEIVDAVVATPGGLPLLSFTLSELYRRYLARGADDRALRAEDYHALGGVVGALRSRAVALHAEATPAEQRTIKNVTLRMLSIEGGQLARRRVSGRELAFADPEEDARVKALLERFTAARLFVRSRGERLVGDGGDGSAEVFVEPAHDTLVLAWDRVHAWLDESGERLAYQRSLWAAARLWDEGGRRRAYLWDSDPRLAVVVAGERAEPAANAIEAAFLAASARKRRRARVRLIVTVVVIFAALALLAVVAVIAAVRANEATEIAKNEADRASAQERKAELEAVIARRRLAASSYDHAQLHDERGDVTRALGRVGAALANVGDDRAGAVYMAKLLDLAARAPHTTARASALARPLLGASLIDPVTGLASRPPAGIDAKRWGGLFALALSHDRRLVAGERDGQIVVVTHGDPGGAPLLAVEQHPQVSGADELFASDMLYNPDYNSSVPEDMRSRLLLSASGETIVVVSVVGDTWAWPARGGARTWADGLWLRAPDSGLAVAASLAIDRRGRSLLWAFDANAGRARVLDVDRREAVIDATLDGVVASVTIAPAADRAYVVVGRPLRPGEQVCSAAARSYDGAVDYVRFERACQPPEGVEPSSTRRFVLHSFALDGGAQLRGLEVIEEHPFAVVDAAADGSRLLTRAQSAGDDAAHGVRVHAQTDRVDRFLRLDVAAASTARAVAFGADGETVVVIDARGELTALRLDSGEPVAAPIHHPNTGLATIRTSLSHDRETFWAVDEDAGWLLGWQVPRARLNPAVALARDGARSPAQVRIDPAQARVYGVVEAERFGDPARVAAWSLTDGAQQWRTELAAVDHWYARLTSDDARVAVASRRRDITGESSPRSGLIDVLQASDGALVARHEERPGEPTQLALAGDELAVEWIRRVYRDDKLEREEHVFERLPVAGGEPTQTCVFPEDASARGYTEDLRYRVGGTPEEPRVWLIQATCPELTGPAFAELISERTSGWPLDDPRARTGASWRDAALLGPPFVAPLLAPGVDEQRTAELVIPGRMQVLRTLRAAPTLGALPGPVAGPWLQLWDPYGAQARPLSGRLWIGNVDSWIRARSGVTLTAAGDGLLYVDAEDRVITHHLGPTPDEPIPGWAVALAEALDEAPPTDAPAPMSDEGPRATAPTIAERAAVDPEMAARQAVRARLQEAADAGDAHATWLIKQAPALRPLTPDP